MMRLRRVCFWLAVLVTIGIALELQPWFPLHREKQVFVANMGQYFRPGAEDKQAAIARLCTLPPPDSSRPDQWQRIPKVILTAKGAYINGSATPVSFDAVISTLANMTDEDWPCGRLIIYFPFAPGVSPLDLHPTPADAVKKIEADFQAAGITWVPAISM